MITPAVDRLFAASGLRKKASPASSSVAISAALSTGGAQPVMAL